MTTSNERFGFQSVLYLFFVPSSLIFHSYAEKRSPSVAHFHISTSETGFLHMQNVLYKKKFVSKLYYTHCRLSS
jgi:hypothetical protein